MLTDAKLRALKGRTKVYRIADSGGLCIEVRPTGARLWRYRYRFAGKANMLPLGEYPAFGLSEARRARDEARALLQAGSDPVSARRARRAAEVERVGNTFSAVVAEWFEQHGSKLSSGTLKRDKRILERHLLPWIGSVPIGDIEAPALLAALRRVQASGRLETAHRCRALAGRVIRYAIATGRAERNPAEDLKGALPSASPEHFASITDPESVGALLRAIDGYQGTAEVVAALRLAPLVFVRPGELRTARWSDIDLDAAEWRYTVRKTATPHLVPLSAQAVALLRDLSALTGSAELVFPGIRSRKKPMSENTINAALRSLGYDGKTITGHGFRAMARTIMDEVLGIRPDLIEHQLAHAVRDPLGRAYNRTAFLPERRRMMQDWADYLDTLREAGKLAPIGNTA